MVMVEVATPFAVTGPVPVKEEFVVDAVCVKFTVPPVNAPGAIKDSVLVSKFEDASVQVDTPKPLELEQAP